MANKDNKMDTSELFDATHLAIEYLDTASPVIFLADCVMDEYEPLIHGSL